MKTSSAVPLTSDRVFVLTYLFWMFAGCALIIPVLLAAMAATELFSARWRETPELFVSGAVVPFLQALAVLAAVACVSAVAFRLGQRDREVTLDGNVVWIRWGTRLPVTIRRILAASLVGFKVAREARYALTPRAGRYGVQSRPDRWRLTAVANGKPVDLGSFETEETATRAAARIEDAGRQA